MKILHLGLMASGLMALSLSVAVAAPMNEAPPSGPVILNLDGSPIPHSFQTYTTSFTASSIVTDFSFAFREDPAFLTLDNVSVAATGGANLVVNGDFEFGPIDAKAPFGWSYVNVYNSAAGGTVRDGVGVGGSIGYYDGSVQAYDAITQQLATTVGTTYTVMFDLTDNSPYSTFSALSTNGNTTDAGGNGINLLVYAGAGIPAPSTVPLPSSAPMFGAAIMVLGSFGLYRRRSKAATLA